MVAAAQAVSEQTRNEPVIRMDQLSSAVIRELEQSYKRKKDLADAYTDAADAVAEKAGIHPSVLKAFIKARVEEKEEEHKQKAEQLQMLFDEVDA